MYQSAFTAVLFTTSLAFAIPGALPQEDKISKNLVREFQCVGTYALPEGKSRTLLPDVPLAFTAKMTDYSLTNPSDPSYLAYVGSMEVAAGFVPQAAKISWTEPRSEDIETDRDDDPHGRNGWGGKAFYAAMLKGDFENPQEVFVLVTMATKEQQGLAVREYEIGAIKMIKPTDQSQQEFKQEVLAEGKMTCKQL
ncbi:MAG TPA: hypothetical protein VM901_08830 [Bdellovibrionota bacterium]|jgi:hypothetical protein|nr:hypothetical protein [Bdellovibrionota bacterium]